MRSSTSPVLKDWADFSALDLFGTFQNVDAAVLIQKPEFAVATSWNMAGDGSLLNPPICRVHCPLDLVRIAKVGKILQDHRVPERLLVKLLPVTASLGS